MDGTRTELYQSVRELAADSSLVALVDVQSQEVLEPASERDIPYTLSTVNVVRSFAPGALGKEVPQGAPSPDTRSGQIVVRQMGTSEMETPAPILQPGTRYLLFLTPTMLEGEAASQYYVTGGSAGIYQAGSAGARSTDGDIFSHGPFEEGDTLPSTLTPKDLAK
jgi:hypothetical protein